MKILLDECLPKKLKFLLNDFETKTATEMGWSSLRNGDLIKAAIENHFDVFLTIDKNIEHQQNLKSYKISIVIFDVRRSKIEFMNPLIPKFIKKIDSFEKGKAYLLS